MSRARIEGFDVLRAAMSVFVVAWHMQGAGASLVFDRERYVEHTLTASDLVNFNVLLLAVPTFIFVSCYLYAAGRPGPEALRRRVGRILLLLLFWPVALVAFKGGYPALVALVPRTAGDLVVLVLRAGYTIYYFFPSLIAGIVLAHVAGRLGTRAQLIGLGVATAAVAGMPALAIRSGHPAIAAFWNPLNFVALPFAAALMAQNRAWVDRHRAAIAGSSAALWALLSAVEWKLLVHAVFFPGQGYAFPAYTRTSLLFGVIAVGAVALDPRVRANGVVRFMSRHSLALYCLHPFLIDPTRNLLATIVPAGAALRYGAIVAVIAISYGFAIVLKRYYLREAVI